MATGILPGNDEATIFESCNRRILLSGGNIVINPELGTKGGSISTHNLSADIPARTAVMTTTICPGHNVVTVFEACNRRHTLIGRRIGINAIIIDLRNTEFTTITKTQLLYTTIGIGTVIAVSCIKIGHRLIDSINPVI